MLSGVGFYLTTYITALIALNRAHVVIRPMYSPERLNRLMLCAIIAVYVLGITFSIPQVCNCSKYV